MAEQKAISQRRKIIWSQNEQTRIQKINNFKCTQLKKNLFSPQIKIDRKIFSLSPTSVLNKSYNSNKNLANEDQEAWHAAKLKQRKIKDRNLLSPSSGYKKIYKSMTHDFQPPKTATWCRPRRLFSKKYHNYNNNENDHL